MSRLTTLDEVLDLITDVKDIDSLFYKDSKDGLVEFNLSCGSVVHSSLLLSDSDFTKLRDILDTILVFQKQV